METEMMPKTKELAEQLEKIGFSIIHCGCGFFRVVNHHGNRTQIEITDDCVRVACQLFGKKGGGSIVLNMRDSRIEHSGDMVSIMVDGSASSFISFYGKKVK